MWFLEGSNIIEEARTQMKDTITYSYKGDFESDGISIAWNLIQYELETCGIDSKDDYDGSDWAADSPTIRGRALKTH